MEARVSGFCFFSNFDSGNLGKVEVNSSTDEPEIPKPTKKKGRRRAMPTPAPLPDPLPSNSSSSSLNLDDAQQPGISPNISESAAQTLSPSDKSFDVWTRKDCQDTPFENGNRTWFFFGIKKDTTYFGHLNKSNFNIRLTIRNLNKQSKLFSQGMVPVFTTVSLSSTKNHCPPSSSHPWERLRERPNYWTEEGQFVISFRIKIDLKQVTYIAFTYPYTYKELQGYLGRLEKKYSSKFCDYESLKSKSANGIYFHRENMIYSLGNRRIDLITLSGFNNILPEREDNLRHLFPPATQANSSSNNNNMGKRPYKFCQKKVIFVSARVHPGETQSSFVFTGLLKFLLRENDARAISLRKKYVFKLIPMLNPDGVVQGHYRTDSRGVNLNRVYAEPSLEHHPQIYAARKLLLYFHYGHEVNQEREEQVATPPSTYEQDSSLSVTSSDASTHWLRSSILPQNELSSMKPPFESANWYEMTETSRFSEGDESIADFSVSPSKCASEAKSTAKLSFSGTFSSSTSSSKPENSRPNKTFLPPPPPLSEESSDHFDFAEKLAKTIKSEKNETTQTECSIVPVNGASGLFLYVDIHGHASKRGIFMYGNHFTPVETKVDSMLLPKLMSINCGNFDFPACNFTERNMYLKDRHTGAGREGSGRVSAFKATGLVYSYTMECNFNTGRVVNSVPMASRDAGRASPPPVYDLPPKYDPSVYEDSGKALAISALDLTESNPWTRLTCSACKNLKGVKESIKKYIKQNEETSKLKENLKNQQVNSPTRSCRRMRTLSSASSSGVVSKPGKISKKGSPLKAPSSPDSYRPVTKIPRKNLSGSNAQTQSSKAILRRSRSIPGASPLSVLPLVSDPLKLPKKNFIIRSKSQSNPGSRPNSPKRQVFGDAVIVKKKKKRKIGVLSTSRKSSDASTISNDLSLTSPNLRKKKIGTKNKKKSSNRLMNV